MRLLNAVLLCSLLTSLACHPGPVLSPGSKLDVGGTIAGIVSTEAKTPLANRKVTAVNVATNARFEATTGVNGGYTIKVPEGTYRIEVELQSGEAIAKQPGETKVNKSDLDPKRDFTITVQKSADL
jgi:hypothetical protein